MMRNKFFKIIIIMIITLPFTLGSCDKFEKQTDGPSIEPVKDLAGSWKVVDIVRNNINITHLFDFSRFTLHLNVDNSYSIENFMPFMVKLDGTWSIDDPIRPYFFTIQENGGEPITVSFSYPIVKGKRRMVMTMQNIGCETNKYVYSLEKSTN